MSAKKDRKPIPRALAAQVLFASDRTCCVCRVQRKPVQIHHIDDDPNHNAFQNLAALCFDCHRDTQITGGFDRKLDDEQVMLYRDDWVQLVARHRAAVEPTDPSGAAVDPSDDVALVTDLVQLYQETADYRSLAFLYARVGNRRLRDQYVELALDETDDPQWMVLLRRAQGRLDLVTDEVVQAALDELAENDWTGQAQLLIELGRPIEAIASMLAGLRAALDREGGSVFTVAYYLKHLGPEIGRELFMDRLRDAEEKGDLWWQYRAMQELGWDEEARRLLVDHAHEIDQSDDDVLKRELARARGDGEAFRRHELAHETAFREALRAEEDPVDEGRRDVGPPG